MYPSARALTRPPARTTLPSTWVAVLELLAVPAAMGPSPFHMLPTCSRPFRDLPCAQSSEELGFVSDIGLEIHHLAEAFGN